MVEVKRQLPGFQSLKAWAQGHGIKYSNAYGMLQQGKFQREDWKKVGTRYFVRLGANTTGALKPSLPVGLITLSEWQSRNNQSYKTTKKFIATGALKPIPFRGSIYLHEAAIPDMAIISASGR